MAESFPYTPPEVWEDTQFAIHRSFPSQYGGSEDDPLFEIVAVDTHSFVLIMPPVGSDAPEGVFDMYVGVNATEGDSDIRGKGLGELLVRIGIAQAQADGYSTLRTPVSAEGLGLLIKVFGKDELRIRQPATDEGGLPVSVEDLEQRLRPSEENQFEYCIEADIASLDTDGWNLPTPQEHELVI